MTNRMLAGIARQLLLTFLCCLSWLGVSNASSAAPRAASAGAEIHGVVRDEKNRVLANASVEIHFGPLLQSAFTDKRGRYQLASLPSGTYHLRASKGGYVTQYADNLFVLPGDRLARDFHLAWGSLSTGGIETSVLSNKGTPLADATIRATRDGTTIATGTTNESGSIVFSDLPAGTYQIDAARPGFRPATVRVVRVRPGQPATAKLRLKPNRDELGYLAGRIRNEAGAPVSRATVKLVQGLSSGTQRTSADGEFTFAGLLPAAGYALQVSAPGYSTQVLSNVLVSPLATTQVEITLLETAPKLGSLAGRVFDAQGIPLPGATVAITSGPASGEQVMTDPDGRFTFLDLQPGSNYRLGITCPGYIPAGSAQMEVRKGVTTSVDFYLTPRQGAAGSLAGGVTDHLGRGIPSALVTIIIGPSAGLAVATNASGAFRFPDLEPSTDYHLSFTHPQYEGVLVSHVTVSPGEETVRNVEMLPVGLRFGEVSGAVRTRDQTPVEGARISLLNGPSAPLQTSSNKNGEFVFRNVRPGAYAARIEKDGFTTVTKANILVQESQVTYVDAVLDQAARVGKISGRVINLLGRGIPDALVVVVSGPAPGAYTRTDNNGYFTLNNLPPGTYTVEASAAGYRNAQKWGITVSARSTTTVTLQLAGQ